MREIKFRGKRIDNGEWVCGYFVVDPTGRNRIYLQPFEDASSNTYYFVTPETVGQYLGHEVNGIEIFEGDIIREEIDLPIEGTETTYSVAVWVKEWSMFATVLIDEYKEFKENGVEGLDDAMFWTFPIREEQYGKRYVAGNIYEHPELLLTNTPN